MNLMKTPKDTAGYKSRCPDYMPCPICYGCRNYDEAYYKCITICKGLKKNVCDTHKHTDKILSKMLMKQSVNTDQEV